MSSRVCCSGTPSAMIATVLICGYCMASAVVSWTERNDAKLMNVTASACLWQASLVVVYTGISTSSVPQ